MDVKTVLKRRDNSIMALTIINIAVVFFLTLLFFTEFGAGTKIDRGLLTYEVYLLPLAIVVQFLVITRFFGVILLLIFYRGGKSLSNSDPHEKIGKYTMKEIQEMVDEQCEKMGVTSVKRVFIIKSQTSNAMTMDVILFEPFRFSVVVLYENLLHVMDRSELETIIGHEIGHVKNRDSWYLGLVGNPTLMMVFILFILIQSMGIYGFHSSFVLIILGSMLLFYLALRPFVKRLIRYCEYYADYTTAMTNGLIPTTNALIKIGQRRDTQLAIQYELQKRFRLDLKTQFSSKFKRRLNEELEDVVDPDEAIEVTRKVVSKFGGEEKQVVKKKHGNNQIFKFKIIDWREYDNHIRDYSLDIEELEPLIRDLKETPHARLFEHASTDSFFALFQTHPRIRDRIIFLWDTLSDKAVKAKEIPVLDLREGKGDFIEIRYICPICQKQFVVRKATSETIVADCPGCGIPGEIEGR